MTSLGYIVSDLGNGSWQIRSPRGSFIGSKDQVFTYSIMELGFMRKELDLGAQVMLKRNNTQAHFGIFKTFIFTKSE